MTEDVGHFILYLLIICVPSFEQCLLNLGSSLHVLDVNPLSHVRPEQLPIGRQKEKRNHKRLSPTLYLKELKWLKK